MQPTSLFAALLLSAAVATPIDPGASPHRSAAVAQEPDGVDELLAALAREYGPKPKKYASLADKLERAVTRALAEGQWDEGVALRLHPGPALTAELADEALELAKDRKRRNGDRQAALLERFPWSAQVEYGIGLKLGSDRPIPDHSEGIIHLGAPAGPFPGYPELVTNHYLFGLQEIVDWQFRVETKGGFHFAGRGPKDPPVMGTELPAWESLRVYLLGVQPAVPLFAIPQLTHRIHARLAEHRAEQAEGEHRMDQVLAFLDARWDGYSFDAPYSEDPTPVVFNAHDLFADSQGFPFRFALSQELYGVGDMPFICSQTNQLYGVEFHGQDLKVSEYNEPYMGAAADVMDAFQAESVYLARYKLLIAQLVRAVASPHLPYPAAMAYLDYPEGRGPTTREARDDLDVPRAHAVLVWAAVGKDPVAYADWLYEHVLSVEEHSFPADTSLATAFTLAVRAREQELLAAVAGNPDPLFQREFSPYSEYLVAEGEPTTVNLLASFHAFHATVSDVIRDTARGLVEREVD